MVANKDLKRVVRARMQKTGESYTAARASVLKKPSTTKPGTPLRPNTPAVSDYPALAGMSDAAVAAKTGCTWEKWVYVLDKAKAYEWDHPEIVKYIQSRYKVGSWWCQMVTVGYERIRGLREVGQRRGGSYEAGKSKTLPVPVERLFKAWSDTRTRKRWLPEAGLVVRTAQPNKSMRITWPDGTSVECMFAAKGDAKSSVAVTHTKLATKPDVAERKAYWNERLTALAAMLA